MPDQLPIEAFSLSTEVMHDLGEWAKAHRSSPTRALAERLAFARAVQRGLPDSVVRHAAQFGLINWRATQRMKEMPETNRIGAAFLRGQVPDLVGVRIRLDLAYPGGIVPPGGKRSVTILLNVDPNLPLSGVLALARTVWRQHLMDAHWERYLGGEITASVAGQVVAGGFYDPHFGAQRS